MLEYTIEGQRVVCGLDDQRRRTWHCDCDDYGRRLAEHGEGFCPHVAEAIFRAYEEGHISLEDG